MNAWQVVEPTKRKPRPRQRFASASDCGVRAGMLRGDAVARRQRPPADDRPDDRRERAAAARAARASGLRVGDRAFDLAAVAHDRRVGDQARRRAASKRATRAAIEARERLAVAVALGEDRSPGEPGLRPFERQELEQRALVVRRARPTRGRGSRAPWRCLRTTRSGGAASFPSRSFASRPMIDNRARDPLARPDTTRSRRSSARWSEPNGLLAAGGDLSPERLSTRTGTASFRGTPRASRCCGGAPIRAWCCSPTSSACRARSRKRVRAAPLRDPRSTRRSSDVIAGRAPTPRDGQGGTWITAGDGRRLRRAAPPRRRALGRGVARRRAGAAASTGSRSAACSSASRCSRARPTRRRSRWCTWSRSCGATASR